MQTEGEKLVARLQRDARTLSTRSRRDLGSLLADARRLQTDLRKRAEKAFKELETRRTRILATVEEQVSRAVETVVDRINVAIGGAGARPFAYYETLAGGAGAGPHGPGLSAVHTHMTNTMNTPVEALEAYYPLRVRRYGVRRGSGGAGRHRGGDGVVREIEFLATAEVTLLAERRRVAPYGLAGGGPGATGRDWIVRDDRRRRLPAKTSLMVGAGDRLRIETPGGGGFGRPGRR